jgi:hypothetical protein
MQGRNTTAIHGRMVMIFELIFGLIGFLGVIMGNLVLGLTLQSFDVNINQLIETIPDLISGIGTAAGA